MSYIRYGSIYKYVEGESTDYIFSTIGTIEDYGSISNETIVELLFTFAEKGDDDDLMMSQMAKRLAENLNIKLRRKPLTFEQQLNALSDKEQKPKRRPTSSRRITR